MCVCVCVCVIMRPNNYCGLKPIPGRVGYRSGTLPRDVIVRRVVVDDVGADWIVVVTCRRPRDLSHTGDAARQSHVCRYPRSRCKQTPPPRRRLSVAMLCALISETLYSGLLIVEKLLQQKSINGIRQMALTCTLNMIC